MTAVDKNEGTNHFHSDTNIIGRNAYTISNVLNPQTSPSIIVASSEREALEIHAAQYHEITVQVVTTGTYSFLCAQFYPLWCVADPVRSSIC